MDVYSVTNPNHLSWLAFQLQVHTYLVNSDFDYDKWEYSYHTLYGEKLLIKYEVNLVSLEIKIKGLLKDGSEINNSLVVESNTTIEEFKAALNAVYQEFYKHL